jgi:hypothetical protein
MENEASLLENLHELVHVGKACSHLALVKTSLGYLSKHFLGLFPDWDRRLSCSGCYLYYLLLVNP